MKYFVKTPRFIKELLSERNITLRSLCYINHADLNEEGFYTDTYLILSRDKLYIIGGNINIAKNTDDSNFDCTRFEELSLCSLEDLSIIRQAHTAQLIAVFKDSERVLCRFSIGYTERFEHFKERAIKLKKGEEIDDRPLSDLPTVCPRCGATYPDPKRRVCPNCVNKRHIIKRLLLLYGDFKKEAAFVIFSMLLTTAFSFVSPIFSTKLLYDDVLRTSGRLYGEVIRVVFILFLIRFFGTILSMVYSAVTAYIAPRLTHKLKVRLFSAMQQLSLDFFTNKQTGTLMTRINHDINHIYSFFIDVVPLLLVNAVTIIGLVVIMFTLQSLLAAFILIVLTLLLLLLRTFHKKQRRYHRRSHNAQRKANSIISDILGGQRVVKAFAKEDSEISRYQVYNHEQRNAEYMMQDHLQRTFPKIRTIIHIAYSALFYLGAIMILSGFNLTLGGLTALIAYANMIYGPMDFLLWFGDWWAACLDSASRVFEIMDATPKISDSENPTIVSGLSGEIELRHVSFEYEVGRPILKDVSFKIRAGQMFGIVGKTGAGKSTIINLITRLYDVSQGEILIDGINIKELRNEDLRRHIGVVSQESYLFIGTVADNIRYSSQNATMEEVVSAAKAAFAHDFILKLPDGYDTKIGSGGVSLSGGERQRLSIARAILQNPTILILDEATASMDTQTERKIQFAIDNLKQGRTIIAIAHRLSTLRDADMLACIDKGVLSEIGTHDGLIHKQAIYFELHKLQSEAFQFVEMGEASPK